MSTDPYQVPRVSRVSEVPPRFVGGHQTDPRLLHAEPAEASRQGGLEVARGAPAPVRMGVDGPAVTYVRFRIDRDQGEIVMQVLDGEKGEVLRQVPPEETLRLMAQLKDYLTSVYERNMPRRGGT